ncbi:hypothetical protein [Pseudoduganella namucuonensis]|uniref:Uncharacterized protein n=1 Tax=Pseudoduganella namucuonensis TaxID=1035707 RepID=A0A1I7M7F9_9BURK|nr:hypothetical protein [Pseudoduganella namucuonensis]SFV17871.1 hypothetical protein SAMN05216552_107810 [Pseudoduganella namucuonensis]
MDRFNRPNKEQIRNWMRQRWMARDPLPDAEQLRRQLQQAWMDDGAGMAERNAHAQGGGPAALAP